MAFQLHGRKEIFPPSAITDLHMADPHTTLKKAKNANLESFLDQCILEWDNEMTNGEDMSFWGTNSIILLASFCANIIF